ncbi:MAG TPA: MFS transporter, partial [Cellulomonadaceae bacterium]|nr:MFS transporter [Cellulomonadaceae bacterium]
MSLTPYADLLRRPGVLRLNLIALVARLPHAMTGVVVTLHVVGTLGKGYAQAGIVAGALTIGMAVGGPWRGRRVDSIGLRRALVPSVVIEASVWTVAPFLGYRALVAAAFVAGLFLVPVFPVVRQSLAVLVPRPQQHTAYALDSVGTELTFMLAPVIGVLIATQVSTTAALVVVGLSTVGAGVLLMWFNPPTRSLDESDGPLSAAADDRGNASQSRLLTSGLLVVLAASAAASFVLNGTDVSIVAVLRHWGEGASIGWMIALWAAGSVVGGLVYGAGRRRVDPLVLVLVLSVATVPATLAGTPLVLAVALVVAGVPCAPALSAITAELVREVREDRRGEVMGWNGTAMTVGAAAGAPICGWAIDRLGPSAGFLVAGVVAGLLAGAGVLVVGASRRR